MVTQSLMVAKAKEELEQEMEEKEEQKAKYLEEKTPPLQTSGMSLEELQVEFHFYYRAAHICKAKLTASRRDQMLVGQRDVTKWRWN